MIILRTKSQVSSFLKRSQKDDYDGTIYDIGSAYVDAKQTGIDGNKVVQTLAIGTGWDEWKTLHTVLAIIKLKRK